MFLLHLVETDNFILHVEYILQLVYQFIVVPRLSDEVGSTVLQSLDRQVHVGVGRQQDDRRLRMLLMDGPKPEESFVAVVDSQREVHVEEHQIDSLLSHRFQDVVRAFQSEYMLKRIVEQIVHRRQDRGVVVYD